MRSITWTLEEVFSCRIPQSLNTWSTKSNVRYSYSCFVAFLDYAPQPSNDEPTKVWIVIFWVGELPLGKIYVTEDGQCIQRISALQVTVGIKSRHPFLCTCTATLSSQIHTSQKSFLRNKLLPRTPVKFAYQLLYHDLTNFVLDFTANIECACFRWGNSWYSSSTKWRRDEHRPHRQCEMERNSRKGWIAPMCFL